MSSSPVPSTKIQLLLGSWMSQTRTTTGLLFLPRTSSFRVYSKPTLEERLTTDKSITEGKGISTSQKDYPTLIATVLLLNSIQPLIEWIGSLKRDKEEKSWREKKGKAGEEKESLWVKEIQGPGTLILLSCADPLITCLEGSKSQSGSGRMSSHGLEVLSLWTTAG